MSQRRKNVKEVTESIKPSPVVGPITKLPPLDSEIEETPLAPLTLDNHYDNDRRESKLQAWRESPFAVGLTEASWKDEQTYQPCCRPDFDPDAAGAGGCMCCSGLLCQRFGRVGNMVVLRETTEWVEEVEEDEETGEETVRRYTRPKLLLLLGPYWPMLCCVTYPLIFGVSGLASLVVFSGNLPFFIVFLWTVMTTALIVSLACTAFRDPGIMHRVPKIPPQSEIAWRWNDTALTYRPRGAIYDPDTAVVVEEFDHTCPWTGTAIGKKNMFYFQCFVGLIFLCLIVDILIITGAFSSHHALSRHARHHQQH